MNKITIDRATVEQALKALRFALHVGFDESSENQIKKGGKAVQQHQAAITTLRQALSDSVEQPAQQEPVATLWQHGETGRTRITTPDEITDCDARWFKAADLYTHPTVIDKSAAIRIATALGWEPPRERLGETK